MSDNCTDTSNEQYEIFWFNYFVSIGYIDSSDLVNLYAPYGKCTRSSLWITYLINVIHFFVLSSGVLYFISIHRVVDQSGLWWPFITWISSFILLLAAVIFFIILNISVTVFSILIIASQIAALIILTIAVFIVVKVIFVIENRYQKLLYFFMIILLLLQTGCFTGQVIITLHCLFNLKFVSTSLDYSYWSAIIAAIGTIISTLLMDHIFMWYLKRHGSSRVSPATTSEYSETEDRSTSPVDPVILEYFHRQPHAPLYYVYSNTTRTRHFHIRPTRHRSVGTRTNVIHLNTPDLDAKRRRHINCFSSSDA